MHKHGGDVYTNKNKLDFSANLNPLGMPEFVAKAAKEAVDIANVYPDVNYSELAEAIAEREGVDKSNIICTNGAAELIFAIAFALKPKKAVLICPSFEEYRQALSVCGCEVENYVLKEENNFCIEEDYLELLTKETDIIFICNPNNPTGKLIDLELMEKIVKRCKKNNIFMAVDECFNDFVENGENYSLKNKGVFILKAFTKMYSMAGLRLGYGIYNDVNVLKKIRTCIQPWSVSVVAQCAGVKAAKDNEFLIKTQKFINQEKIFLLKNLSPFVEKIYGFDANYIFFKAEKDLYEKLYEHDIVVRDCGNFTGLKKGFYRIAVKTTHENIRLIKALESIKEQKNG